MVQVLTDLGTISKPKYCGRCGAGAILQNVWRSSPMMAEVFEAMVIGLRVR